MSEVNQELGQEMGWDDPISHDQEEYELLPAGEYSFTVESMERGRFSGSEKMSACNCAKLTLDIISPTTGKTVKVFDTLYLNTKAEWRIAQFLCAIGQRKHGEEIRPNWAQVPTSTGRCEITVNSYTPKNGGEARQNNKIGKYLEAQTKAFVPGKF